MEEYKTLDINKKILFLVSRIDAIPHVEMYLRKRDWSLKLTTGLKEAIAYLVQERPSYFFVSYDFPNKKALALVRSPALEHMTNIVLTGEVTKPNTIKGIQEFKIQYKLQPPMTGPAIERIVNKIIKDLEKQEEDIQENLKKGTLTKEQEKIIKIRSNKAAIGFDTIIQSGVGLGEMLSSSDEITSAEVEGRVSYELESSTKQTGSLNGFNLNSETKESSVTQLDQMKALFKKAADKAFQ